MAILGALKSMDDGAIQRWLCDIGQSNVTALAVALVGTDASVRDCIHRNMSEFAKRVLAEDVEKKREPKDRAGDDTG